MCAHLKICTRFLNTYNMYILYMGLKQKHIWYMVYIQRMYIYIYCRYGPFGPQINLSIYLSIHPFIHPSIHLSTIHGSIYIHQTSGRVYICICTQSMYVNVCVCRCTAGVHKVTIASKLGYNPKVSDCKGKLLSNCFNRINSPWHPEYSCHVHRTCLPT